MKTSDITVGQVVAVSRLIDAKHINVLDNEDADLELLESEQISGLGALTLLSKGRRGWLAYRLRDHADYAWGVTNNPLRGTVQETGLLWCGKKSGVLVTIEPPEKIGRVLTVLGIPDIVVLVPSTMIADYWDTMSALEAERARYRYMFVVDGGDRA